MQQRLVAVLVARGVAEGRGLSPAQHLRMVLRLSPIEAKGRVQRAADAAPRRALSGEHLPAWAHGGTTDLDNLILLCGQHHRAVHAGHCTIGTREGVPEVRPPPWTRAA